MQDDHFTKLRSRYLIATVTLSLGLLSYADTTARGFHVSVLIAAMLGLLLSARIRLGIPVVFWNTIAIGVLFLAVVWIRRDVSKIFEILLYFLEILLVVKAFSRRSSRDYWQIYLACFFVVIAGALTLSNVWIVPILLVFTGLACMAMVADTLAEPENVVSGFAQRLIHGKSGRFWDIRWGAVAVVLLSTAVAIINFIAIPRLSRAFFDLGFLRTGGGTRSGLSGQVDLRQRGTIQLDPEIAGKLQITGVSPAALENLRKVYLPARRLDSFDGIRWFASQREATRVEPNRSRTYWIRPEKAGVPSLGYSIILKPIGQPFVPQLENTVAVRFSSPVELLAYRELDNLITGETLSHPVRYEAWRTFDPVIQPLPDKVMSNLTSVPEGIHPRVLQLADSLGSKSLPAETVIGRISEYFQMGFNYSLDRKSGEAENVLENFLFETRSGHCEYFASAAALIARINGIPARVVTGYLLMERNDDNSWLIRDRDAHAWVEYLQPGVGWVSFDPSPGNIEAERLAGNNWRTRLLTVAGKLELWWVDKVIDFDLRDQFRLLQTLLQRLDEVPTRHKGTPSEGKNGPSDDPEPLNIAGLSTWIVAGLSALALSAAAYGYWKNGRKSGLGHPATEEFERLYRSIHAEEGPVLNGDTAATLLLAAKDNPARNLNDADYRLWIRLYQEARFGLGQQKSSLPALRKLTSKLIQNKKVRPHIRD